MLTCIFEHKSEEVTGGWRKLHSVMRGFITCTLREQIEECVKIGACSIANEDEKFVHSFSLKT
jgi:hypothetical protein